MLVFYFDFDELDAVTAVSAQIESWTDGDGYVMTREPIAPLGGAIAIAHASPDPLGRFAAAYNVEFPTGAIEGTFDTDLGVLDARICGDDVLPECHPELECVVDRRSGSVTEGEAICEKRCDVDSDCFFTEDTCTGTASSCPDCTDEFSFCERG